MRAYSWTDFCCAWQVKVDDRERIFVHIHGLISAVCGYILKVADRERVCVHIRGLISAVRGH